MTDIVGDFEFTNDRVVDYRGYKLVFTDPHGLVHVERATGGHIPKMLQGQWTGVHELQKRIDVYEGQKEQEENKPPQDKNTQAVQDRLNTPVNKVPVVETVGTTSDNPTKDMFASPVVEKKKYQEISTTSREEPNKSK